MEWFFGLAIMTPTQFGVDPWFSDMVFPCSGVARVGVADSHALVWLFKLVIMTGTTWRGFLSRE